MQIILEPRLMLNRSVAIHLHVEFRRVRAGTSQIMDCAVHPIDPEGYTFANAGP